MADALDQVKDELDDDVVFAPEDFCDSVGDPSNWYAVRKGAGPMVAVGR
jgi:hypothetical protein